MWSACRPRAVRAVTAAGAVPRGRPWCASGCPAAPRAAVQPDQLGHLESVVALGDHLDVPRTAENHPQAGTDQVLIVGEHDFDHGCLPFGLVSPGRIISSAGTTGRHRSDTLR